jgi:hypothetical protein
MAAARTTLALCALLVLGLAASEAAPPAAPMRVSLGKRVPDTAARTANAADVPLINYLDAQVWMGCLVSIKAAEGAVVWGFAITRAPF